MEPTLREAKARLSEVLDRAAAGETIEIVRRGAKKGRFRELAVDSGGVAGRADGPRRLQRARPGSPRRLRGTVGLRILLDTHVLLWWQADDPGLEPVARDLIARHESTVSLASFWGSR